MDKFTTYRTALDALNFIYSADLGFSPETKVVVKQLFVHVCDLLGDYLNDSEDGNS